MCTAPAINNKYMLCYCCNRHEMAKCTLSQICVNTLIQRVTTCNNVEISGKQNVLSGSNEGLVHDSSDCYLVEINTIAILFLI